MLPPSLMVFWYYVVQDTFYTFQNGMENNYYWIQINHIHKLHSKENGIDHMGKCDPVISYLPKIDCIKWRLKDLEIYTWAYFEQLENMFCCLKESSQLFSDQFLKCFWCWRFLPTFIMVSQCWTSIAGAYWWCSLFKKYISLKTLHFIPGSSESAKGMVHPHQQRAKICFQQKSCPVPCII